MRCGRFTWARVSLVRRTAAIAPWLLGRTLGGQDTRRRYLQDQLAVLDRSGAPQTQNVTINERFTVVQDGSRLDYVMTVNEPASLVKPFVWNAYFVWNPGEAINPYECTLEEWASIKNTLRK